MSEVDLAAIRSPSSATRQPPTTSHPSSPTPNEALKTTEVIKPRDRTGALILKLKEAAKVVREGYAETLAYTRFPMEHWRRIRTNNSIERLNREIRRRTRVVGTFPDGKSALMLVTAR